MFPHYNESYSKDEYVLFNLYLIHGKNIIVKFNY